MSLHVLRVDGVPVAQGSKRAFVHPRTGRAVVTEQLGARLRDWRGDVRYAMGRYVEDAERDFPVVDEPIHLTLTFSMPRPKKHYGKDGVKERYVSAGFLKAPDIDKLARSVLDAGTGVFWRDDCLIVELNVRKRFADELAGPGMNVQMVVG